MRKSKYSRLQNAEAIITLLTLATPADLEGLRELADKHFTKYVLPETQEIYEPQIRRACTCKIGLLPCPQHG